MKTLKSMLAIIVILFAGSATSNAAAKSHRSQPSQTDVVNIYISAITNGQMDNLDKILDNDLQFNMQRGQNVNTLTKNQLMDYLKNNGASSTNVSTKTTVLTDDDDMTKVKVEFQFDGYTRVDILTLNKSFGWKVTTVNSSYK